MNNNEYLTELANRAYAQRVSQAQALLDSALNMDPVQWPDKSERVARRQAELDRVIQNG